MKVGKVNLLLQLDGQTPIFKVQVDRRVSIE